MNWDQIKGSWMQTKGVVRKKWGNLTDDDVDVIGGKRDTLQGKKTEIRYFRVSHVAGRAPLDPELRTHFSM